MRCRILIIDDNPIVRSALARLLKSRYEIDVAADAAQALAVASDAHDVVLCDLAMPEMSGVDLIRSLSDRVPNVAKRVIFMTGGADSKVLEEVMTELRRPVLLKPFALHDLDVAVSRLLDNDRVTAGR